MHNLEQQDLQNKFKHKYKLEIAYIHCKLEIPMHTCKVDSYLLFEDLNILIWRFIPCW
jgi:hypothetical protein